MELDEINCDESRTGKYEGSIQVHGLRISHVSTLREIKDCPARFRLDYRFNFPGGVIEGTHAHNAVVTRGRHSDWWVAA